MLYGIEQSTDLRCPRTVVKKFSTLSSLLRWMEGGGGFTYDDPDVARNYHHTFRYGYKLIGRVNWKDQIFSDRGTGFYPRNSSDNLASYIYKYGVEL